MLFEASCLATILSFITVNAKCKHILSYLKYFNCFYAQTYLKKKPDLLFSFTLEQSFLFCNLPNVKLHQLFHLLLFCAFCTVYPCDCLEYPTNIRCLKWHPAKESKIRPKFMVHHIKKWNLDGLELHLRFEEALKLPSIEQLRGWQS